MGHAPPWYIKNAIPWFLLVLAWWWELACACLLAALLLSSHEGGLHVVHLSLCTDAVVCMLFRRVIGDISVRRVAGKLHFAVHQQSFVDVLPQVSQSCMLQIAVVTFSPSLSQAGSLLQTGSVSTMVLWFGHSPQYSCNRPVIRSSALA